ncbi:helix-turn-helix transcriptional regulator [Anditalea andensis]|uniref:AraC family transcriptional regulator n=1 Tax=Anditalea andensis TaxID=1048983 RepID=A0A074L596_9BACT|nr:AraC family transcriptional regulator [Anditalea andensis]KEO75615.1 AraC family transcriptional regulator [Anditalea andensis]
MKELKTGNFYGNTDQTHHLDGLVLTDTEYTIPRTEWHFHENAYFTFIIAGKVLECNKRESFNCEEGTLLFHHWQEAHYNVKPPGYTRGFHLEIHKEWMEEIFPSQSSPEGSMSIEDPSIKLLFYQIYREAKIQDDLLKPATEALLLKTLSLLTSRTGTRDRNPLWVPKVREIIYDSYHEPFSLRDIAQELNLHPVHLSRDFSKYFNCTLGEYIRKIKVEKSLSMFSRHDMTLTEIAHQCGFSDQSHYNRCFKQLMGLPPATFRKIIRRC